MSGRRGTHRPAYGVGRQPHPIIEQATAERFASPPGPAPERERPAARFAEGVGETPAEVKAIAARLRRAGAGDFLEVGQCDHGWFARAKMPDGRTTRTVEAHGHVSRLEAVEQVAADVEAIARRRKRGRRG